MGRFRIIIIRNFSAYCRYYSQSKICGLIEYFYKIKMIVRAIDWFESNFIGGTNASLPVQRDASKAENEEISEKRKNLRYLAFVPFFSLLYFVSVSVSRRTFEFSGNSVLCVLEIILLRQTSNKVRTQNVASVNHAEQVCQLFGVLFWSKAYANLYSADTGGMFDKTRRQKLADATVLAFCGYSFHVSCLAFRRLAIIYAMHCAMIKEQEPTLSDFNKTFQVDDDGNFTSRGNRINADDDEEQQQQQKSNAVECLGNEDDDVVRN